MATKSNIAQHGGAHSKKYEHEIKSDAGSWKFVNVKQDH
jgi:hypothetical protein